MQVHIYTTQKLESASHSSRLIDLIAKSAPNSGLTIGAESPDVVHIWGLWNSRTISEIKRWQRVFTPVVFSSMEGLAEICRIESDLRQRIEKRNRIKTICQLADIVVAQGKEEQRIISQYGGKEALTILNPYVTSLTSEQKCIEKLTSVYSELYASHDKQMQSACQQRAANATDEPTMQHLIATTLYVDYLFRHGTCHDDNLKLLANAYIKAEMADEDAFANITKRMKIYSLVGRLMAIMQHRKMISEGFMPIEPLEDKHTKQLEATIKGM